MEAGARIERSLLNFGNAPELIMFWSEYDVVTYKKLRDRAMRRIS